MTGESSLPPDAPQSGGRKAGRSARRYRKRYAFSALLSGVVGFFAILFIGFMLLVGRELQAPDWLQEVVQERVDTAVPDIDIDVGQIYLKIEPGDLSPRVFLKNVMVLDETGLPFLSLGELSVRASFAAALQGQFIPRKIGLSGALVKLRRSSDGSFDVTLGSALQSAGQAPTLAQLIENLDTLLVEPQLARLTEMRAEALTVLYEDARAGRAWTVDGGRVLLTRSGDDLSLRGDFALLGGLDHAATLAMSYDGVIGSQEAQIGLTVSDVPASDVATQSPALAWIGVFQAPLSGALRTSVDASGALGLLNATLQAGSGVIQPEEEAAPIPFDGAQAYFSYDAQNGVLDFDHLQVQSAWINGTASGRATLVGMDEGWPRALTAQLQLAELEANPFGLYEEPVTVRSARTDLRLGLEPFSLDVGQLVIEEAGQVILASANAQIEQDGWHAGIDARAATLELDQILRVWPEGAKTRTRQWLRSNILSGGLHDAQFAMRMAQGQKPQLHLAVGFQDAEVRFLKGLPPIEEASGVVRLESNRLVVAAQSGHVKAAQGGTVDASGTVFEIPDVRIKQGPARVRLNTSGSVTSALSLLDAPPLAVLSKAGLLPTLADGALELSGFIDFDLRPKVPLEEIDFEIAGAARNVRSETLIEGRVLASSKLDVFANSERVRVAGSGRLDQVPFEGAWVQPIGRKGAASEVSGQIELSERFVDTFNIGLPAGSVRGKGSGQISLTLQKGKRPAFALTSDLRGVAMRIAPLGWSKAASGRGSLSVRGTLGSRKGEAPEITGLALDAPGLKANGKVTLAASGGLRQAVFSQVRAGSWLDSAVTLTGRGARQPPAISLQGGRLDMRSLPEQSGAGSGGSAQAIPISVAVDELRVTKDVFLRRFRGDFTSNGGLAGSFTGNVNGATPIAGRAFGRGGRTGFEVTSQNAGAALSAAGLLTSARQGSLRLVLQPVGGPGTFDGSLEIDNLRLSKPPDALALLSAASGIGLLEQLDGKGLSFQEVRARFKMTPQTVTIAEASAVGPSIGLSVDGYYSVPNGTVDMQGVVSPLYAINGIGALFTRRGEGLIGFNYTLEGAVKAPRVRVNPLSLFTPGMFRELFRRPAPKITQ